MTGTDVCPCSLHSPAEGHWLGSRKALDCQRHTALDQTPVKRTVLCPLLGPRSRSSVRTQQLVGCEGVSSPVREGAGRPRAHSAHRVTRVDPLGIHSEGVGGASPVITSLARQGRGHTQDKKSTQQQSHLAEWQARGERRCVVLVWPSSPSVRIDAQRGRSARRPCGPLRVRPFTARVWLLSETGVQR